VIIQRILRCTVLVLSAFGPVFAVELTSLAQVKTLVLHDVAPSEESARCLSVLADRLVAAGFILADSADAEMNVTRAVSAPIQAPGGAVYADPNYDGNYRIEILSLPSHLELFRFTDRKTHEQRSVSGDCLRMAKTIVRTIDDAKKRATTPEAAGSDKPK
jgi:hypothetical protein